MVFVSAQRPGQIGAAFGERLLGSVGYPCWCPLPAPKIGTHHLFRSSDSIRPTIRLASATASAIAAKYAGEFLGTVASFLAARIEAHTAMMADLRGSSTGRM
jgi:hypothetical protein